MERRNEYAADLLIVRSKLEHNDDAICIQFDCFNLLFVMRIRITQEEEAPRFSN